MSPILKVASLFAAGAVLTTTSALAAQPAATMSNEMPATIIITTQPDGVRSTVVDAGLYDLSQDGERVRLDGVLRDASYTVCEQPHMRDRMSDMRVTMCAGRALKDARAQVSERLAGQQVASLRIVVAAR